MIIEIAILTTVPNLHCAPLAAFFLAHTHALGVVAVGAERRRSASADHLVAAVMFLFLFLEALAQGFHELVPTAEAFDQGLFFIGQIQFFLLTEPFQRDVADDLVEEHLLAAEMFAENLIETIEIPLIFDQRGPR